MACSPSQTQMSESQSQSMKEQRQEYRTLTRVEKTSEFLSGTHSPPVSHRGLSGDINQIETISKHIIDVCKEHGGTLPISDVFKIISADARLILDKRQAQFVASHGVKSSLFSLVSIG